MLADGFTEDAPVELGCGVTATLQRFKGEPDAVKYTHVCNGTAREDYIPVEPSWSNGWSLLSLAPLTLSPSLACTSCGHHGFIRDGRWIPA